MIHTSYYSVENHLLTEGTLGCLDIWNRVGGSVKYPWKNILEEFAKAIGDILRISISSTAFAIKERKEGRPCTSFLTIGKLHQEIDNLSFCLSTYSSDFAQWKIAMDSKYGNLKNTCTSEYSIIGELMKSDSPLVFLQGHSLYDFLLKIMKLCFAENKSIAIHNISTNTSLTKQEQIEQIRGNILSTLKLHLHNSAITLVVNVVEHEGPVHILTRREQYEQMEKENPSVAKLREAFQLELA